MAKRLQRNSSKARLLHLVNLIVFVVFFYTGTALIAPSLNVLANIIGGFEVARILHRIAAAVLFLEVVVVLITNFDSFKGFLKETFSWHKGDGRWVASFFIWLFRPNMKMPHTKTRESAGQRLVAWVLIGFGLWQVITGFILMYRPGFSKQTVLVATTLHDVGFFALAIFLLGHIYIGLGLFKPYRGVRTAMFGDGTVDEKLAKRLWPDWASKAEVVDK